VPVKWTDADILEGCLKQKPQAQRALYEQYGRRMMSVCLRYIPHRPEAEDVFHEAFIKVFGHLADHRGGSLEGWMRRIFVNESINYYNRKYKKRLEDEIASADLVPQAPDALHQLGAEELHRLISDLPAGCRMVFNLYAVEGFEHKEIAQLMGISEGTSKSQFHRARMLLQAKIEPRV
jgi:RNA polymerase sigma factor (sigma-70 family)